MLNGALSCGRSNGTNGAAPEKKGEAEEGDKRKKRSKDGWVGITGRLGYLDGLHVASCQLAPGSMQ